MLYIKVNIQCKPTIITSFILPTTGYINKLTDLQNVPVDVSAEAVCV